ncbi:MAG: NADH-quinone oxidoreductase subunit NuoN, partial [Actinomycetota bacterium]|nr:NADH-quinone oxidoreductase subunit NuoN [Actinomycetota bacterium]
MPVEIQSPALSYAPIAPLLLVFAAALISVLVEAFAPASRRRAVQIWVCAVGLVAALAAVILLAGTEELTFSGAIAVDGPALFLQGTLAVLGLAAILLLSERSLDSSGGAVVARAAVLPGSREDAALAEATEVQTEIYPLALFSLGGMMLFTACNNLLLMFVALEVLSLPLYLMAGLARRRRLLSQEAAVKYFLLGAFASAFFMYGVALLYGYAGSVDLGDIFAATGTAGTNDALLFVGLAMLAVGLLFKVGAVPFQAWTPDVYQGSPTPVTALMAACTKIAAFGALLRVLYVGFGRTEWDWRPMMWGIAILTMVVGAVLAVTQTDVKRMLAYSSIAHTGFILVGVIALSPQGLSGTLFYLLAYGFTTLASFAVVTLVRDSSGEATHLSQWAGLGRKSPLVAGTFAFFLAALAGIPLTSGFMAKFAVFAAGVEGGATALVIVGVVASA